MKLEPRTAALMMLACLAGCNPKGPEPPRITVPSPPMTAPSAAPDIQGTLTQMNPMTPTIDSPWLSGSVTLSTSTGSPVILRVYSDSGLFVTKAGERTTLQFGGLQAYTGKP